MNTHPSLTPPPEPLARLRATFDPFYLARSEKAADDLDRARAAPAPDDDP